MSGRPVLVDKAFENVLFPDPGIPVTITRWPTAPDALPT
jgi:hypothetical protein